MNGSREKVYAYWLDNVKGIGRKTIIRILEQYGNAEKFYFAEDDERMNILSQKQREQVRTSRRQWNLYTEYERLTMQKIKFYHLGDPDYPEKLRMIPDAPYALYVKGKLPDHGGRTIAVIGARTCTEYGRVIAGQFAGAFADAGIQIISGMARGIDGISQKAAIDHGGQTFAVLGCGCNICYPPESRQLYEQICERGGVISEYLPDTQPMPSLFPPRNRIISGLADAILVIEAKEKSGTLITVDMALEQGRDIFAIPGRVTDSLSSGCNRLIRQGAGMAITPREVLKELYGDAFYDSVSVQQDNDSGTGIRMEHLPEMEKTILQKTDYVPLSLEILLDRCRSCVPGMSLQQLMTCLLSLQLKGMIGREGSHYFKVGP